MIAVLCLGAACCAGAQTAGDPSLHRRSASATPDTSADTRPSSQTGTSTLPADASGEYLLDESGSVIQITIESGKLSGYVTRMGDEQSDKDTPLTLFFEQTSAHGSHLSFTTRKVHGIWYSFDGSIVRGDPKTTMDEDGYYLLRGSWAVHDDGRKSQSSQTVSFKSTPRRG
jgi:hypothetical protein